MNLAREPRCMKASSYCRDLYNYLYHLEVYLRYLILYPCQDYCNFTKRGGKNTSQYTMIFIRTPKQGPYLSPKIEHSEPFKAQADITELLGAFGVILEASTGNIRLWPSGPGRKGWKALTVVRCLKRGSL